jgi:hypothetical protein
LIKATVDTGHINQNPTTQEIVMALSSKSLQKKRAKKAEKRKAVHKAKAGLIESLGFAQEWRQACKGPIEDVLVPKHLFDEGIGNIWFSRRLADGRYAMAGFLVDTYCLGIKNALYVISTPENYRQNMARVEARDSEEPMSREHPAYARKLVEKAEAYARELGFEPHSDYQLARKIFGDVDADSCPSPITFGKDGKPYYVCGPNDTPTFQRRVIQQLEKRCGPGGFDWLIGMPDEDD